MEDLKQIRDLKIALKDMEPYIKNPNFLTQGKRFSNFNMLVREAWANLLICAVMEKITGERFTFQESDGDGIIGSKDSKIGYIAEVERGSVVRASRKEASVVKLVVTVDVEEDQWGIVPHCHATARNVYRLPTLQKLLNEFGIVPTYLLTYPVVRDPHAVGILREIFDAGECEIGTHCHPWNTPPYEEPLNKPDE